MPMPQKDAFRSKKEKDIPKKKPTPASGGKTDTTVRTATEEKMKLLGCDRHPSYRLAFYLDNRAMISIHSEKYGVVEVGKTIKICKI